MASDNDYNDEHKYKPVKNNGTNRCFFGCLSFGHALSERWKIVELTLVLFGVWALGLGEVGELLHILGERICKFLTWSSELDPSLALGELVGRVQLQNFLCLVMCELVCQTNLEGSRHGSEVDD